MRRSAALFLLLWCGPGLVHASEEDLFGHGTVAPALAGGGAALVRGAAAVHANPALLNLRRERVLTLGFAAHLFTVSLDGRRHPIDPVRGALIGVTLPLPFLGALRDRVTLGLGFFVPSQVVVRGDMLFSEDPQFLLLDSRGQSVAIQLALGADLTDGLSAGVGFRALAELIGTVQLTSDAAGRLGSQVEDQLVATYAPTAGLRGRFGPIEVGLAMRGELSGRIDVDVIAEDTPVPLPNLNIAGIAQYDPFELALEAAWTVRPGLTLAAGATYQRWSAYDGPLEQTTQAGPPPDNPVLHDVVAPHLCVEWMPGHADGDTPSGGVFTLRAGVGLQPTPTEPATETTRTYDSSRVRVGLGAGWVLARPPVPPLRFDVYAEEQVLVARTHREGTTSAGSILSMGLSVGVTF